MSSTSAYAGAAAAAASTTTKICFNTYCKEAKSEVSVRRKGWRLRSGDLADLCDRCSTSYEQGSFCETFHSDGDGWRKCETCGKRVHCGCIVSVATFALLDAGGIECVSCAQKSFVMGPNQMWSSSLFLQSEKLKELPAKSWSHLTATSPVPGQWRQAPNAWSAAVAAQSDLHQRLSFEFDRPNSIEKLLSGGRSSVSEKRKVEDLPERPMSTGLNRITIDRLVNGSPGMKQSGFGAFHRDEGSVDRLQEPSLLVGDGDPIPTRKGVIHGSRFSSSAGVKIEKVPNTCISGPLRSPMLKDDTTTAIVGLSAPFSPSLEANDQARVSANPAHSQAPPNLMAKHLYLGANNGIECSGESGNQVRNGRPRMDGSRGRNQLLPRYWPRITDQELQQISGDSNSVITPLFEKMLSASDAGRIGRLVLPKKCAEAYFPAISQPEGLPLKVQDASGKEWVFQFRFWPNNNSRMYVLEGVTPCIQSMQLQAGDTVTFSRIDPEGKLVMGFRKASNVQSEQALKSGNGFSLGSDASNRNGKQGETASSLTCLVKGNSESTLGNAADRTTWSKFDKADFIQKERPTAKPFLIPSKRKSGTVGSKSKRLRIENEDSIELKLTWEEAQELLRPPPNRVPSIVEIDGHEFEEYEEAPVLGKPTIFTTNQHGGKDQWAQCEDCLKWRKLPVDALLPPRWTCSENSWDTERSSCSSAQEISKEQLADLIPFSSATSKKSKAKVENNAVEGSDGLDTLANLAILGEGESPPHSSPPTTKHPRHRPGCTCIVCIQPPSGKGPKHKQTCCCNVCLTVKRRFRTLMLRKEKRQSEKEAETARKKQQHTQSPEASPQQEIDMPGTGKDIIHVQKTSTSNDGVVDDDADKRKELLSPMKTEIDLNMQPEREEETSPVSDADNTMRLAQDSNS